MCAATLTEPGTIREIRTDDKAVWYTISAEPKVLRYIVEKGSITIDGISLTVAAAAADHFSVSTIPHTNAVTTLGERKVGDLAQSGNRCHRKICGETYASGRTGDAAEYRSRHEA